MSAEMGGKGCQKSCDVRKCAENIGEPRKSLLRDREDVLGPVALQGWNTILPIPASNSNTPRPRTITYFKARPDLSVTLRPDLIEDRDVQFLDISQPGQPVVSIINVYNDPTKGEGSVLNKIRLQNNILPLRPTLITGDYNLHYPKWSKDDRLFHPDQLTCDLVDWLAQANYTMLNQKGEITHFRRRD